MPCSSSATIAPSKVAESAPRMTVINSVAQQNLDQREATPSLSAEATASLACPRHKSHRS